MRSSLLACSLLLSSAAFAADTKAPAGDTPSPEAKAEAPKPDPDIAKASVDEFNGSLYDLESFAN